MNEYNCQYQCEHSIWHTYACVYDLSSALSAHNDAVMDDPHMNFRIIVITDNVVTEYYAQTVQE